MNSFTGRPFFVGGRGAHKQYRETLLISLFPKTIVFTLLSVNSFTGRPFFMGARGAP